MKRISTAVRLAPWAHLVGVETDSGLARLSGVPCRSISKFRVRQGLPVAAGPQRPRTHALDDIEQAVHDGGLQPIWRIAQRLGLSTWKTLDEPIRARLRTALHYLVKHGRVQRVRHGVFAPPGWTMETHAKALALAVCCPTCGAVSGCDCLRPDGVRTYTEVHRTRQRKGDTEGVPLRARRQPKQHTGDAPEPARAAPFALRAYL